MESVEVLSEDFSAMPGLEQCHFVVHNKQQMFTLDVKIGVKIK